MNPETLLADLKRDPDVLFQDLDLVNRRGLLVRITEADYRRASFLDHRVLRPDTEGAWFPLARILKEAAGVGQPLPPHFIFHISHCGSTLVSRLLSELPGNLPVREPLPVLGLAMQRRELNRSAARITERAWDELFELSLRLLGRAYRPGERSFIKATSACANLLDPLAAKSPASRALLLYTDLETWLCTMLRDEVVRENGRFYAAAWLTDFTVMTGHTDIMLSELTDAEQFTLNWLTGMLHFEKARQATPERVLPCDFDAFLADPGAGLESAARFFGLDSTRAREAAVGRLMHSYAKNPNQVYDGSKRLQELKEARERFGKEVETGLAFAARLSREHAMLEPIVPHFHR